MAVFTQPREDRKAFGLPSDEPPLYPSRVASSSNDEIRLHCLGGADSIGASATLVALGTHRLLVDCGIRMGASGGDALPDLDPIREGGRLDAIVLTHAHLDHSGGLPVILRSQPDVPIFCTPPTADLVRILLYNSIGLMRERQNLEGEIPLYRPEEVESLLERMIPVHFEIPFTFPSTSSWSGRFFTAGHILGAATLLLESDAGSVFFTGDCALSEQRTVSGMSAPKVRPKLAVIESTYGDRLHVDRAGQERALVRQICEAYERNGKVLIPAFAIGRAQEVLLVLRSAITKGELPDHPVYVDGMVTPVCSVYGDYPRYLSGRLYRRATRRHSLFFSEHVRAVTTPRERDTILDAGPCTIVASSGMLSGGPSAWYAGRLAQTAENLIAITGYQDEESPGRRLLDLAAGKATEALLPGGAVPVRCEVAAYALSAHADSDELASLAARLRPEEIVLVHGDEGARAELSRKIHAQTHRNVQLPHNGDPLLFRGRRTSVTTGPLPSPKPGISNGRPVDADALTALYTHLLNEQGAEAGRRVYSLVELAGRWTGTTPSSEDVDAWVSLLADETYFVSDRKRPFLFRLRPLEEAHQTFVQKQKDEDRSPWLPVLETIRTALGPDAGIVKEGYYADEQRIVLYFRFPAIADRRHARRLHRVAQETGWRIEIHPHQNKALLLEALRECLRTGTHAPSATSYRDDERLMRVRIDKPDEEGRKRMAKDADAFRDRTGWALEWVEIAPAAPCVTDAQPAELPAPDAVPPDGQPMEINASYRLIASAFARTTHRPYRWGLKRDGDGEFIEVSFVTPEIGERVRDRLDELAVRIGRPLRVSRNPNQAMLSQKVRELMQSHGGVRREPRLHVGRKTAAVHPSLSLESSAREEVRAAFTAFCGYEIIFE